VDFAQIYFSILFLKQIENIFTDVMSIQTITKSDERNSETSIEDQARV
jgi:hypothetical protein